MPREWADQLVVLRERRDWLAARILAKQSIGWDTDWDRREFDALTWALLVLEADRPEPHT